MFLCSNNKAIQFSVVDEVFVFVCQLHIVHISLLYCSLFDESNMPARTERGSSLLVQLDMEMQSSNFCCHTHERDVNRKSIKPKVPHSAMAGLYDPRTEL